LGEIEEAMTKGFIAVAGLVATVAVLFVIAALKITPPQIVALGASNVAGFGVSRSEAFPAQLEAMLRAKGYDITIRNAGVSGNTTKDMLNRFGFDVPPHTKVVILDMSGGYFNNNLKGISEQQGYADMSAIMAGLYGRGIKIIPESAAPISKRYKQQDGVHLTAEGHHMIADQLLPQLIAPLGPPK
jgi:acyl-CoA thioesterase-1